MTHETVTYDADEQGRSVHNSTDPLLAIGTGSKTKTDRHQLLGTSWYSGTVKRIFDLSCATIGLVLLLPLLLLIACAVKLTSKGPVFFQQERQGLNGKPFPVFKFRTMYSHLCDQSGVEQTIKDDPRITLVGRFLRKSNFDELPQLLNVIRGEMSLVGPRPHAAGMLAAGQPYEEFDPRYKNRLKVRPGITGLAQVDGFRGETKDAFAARMRLEYDLQYIETQSLWLDVKIIALTFLREFVGGRGY